MPRIRSRDFTRAVPGDLSGGFGDSAVRMATSVLLPAVLVALGFQCAYKYIQPVGVERVSSELDGIGLDDVHDATIRRMLEALDAWESPTLP